jgi:HK97 family phage major capsid protein
MNMAESDYALRIEREQSGTDARELPEAVRREVIQDVQVSSVVLQLANVQRMSTRQERLTLQESFPQAYWLTGTADYPVTGGTNNSGSQRAKDSQPKRTTAMTWNTRSLAAEELAVLVAIPDNYVDDSGAPLFDEVRPRIAEAMAKKIDAACLYGTDSPFAEPGIVENAIMHGNIVTVGSTEDLAADIALLGELAGEEGVDFTTFIAGPGFKWKLPGLRSKDGLPIYSPPAAGNPGVLYGLPILEVKNGMWDKDLALTLAGEWDKVRIGIRQDITFSLSDSATIYNPETGRITYSAFQQDGKVLRAVMRIAYVVVNPVRHLGNLYPFWVLQDQLLS